MAFDRDQFIERLQQMRRPLQFAARQNVRKIAVLQDLEARLLEWLDAATALQPPADIVANLDACRRLFTGFDRAEPTKKIQVITTALSRLEHLMELVAKQFPENSQRYALPSPPASPHPADSSASASEKSVDILAQPI